MESSRKISEYLPPYIVIGVVLFNGWLFKRYQKDIFRSVIFLSRLVRLGMKLTFVLFTIVIKYLRKNNVLEYEGSHSFYAQVTAYSIIQYLACPYTTFLYSFVVFILSFIAADLMFVFIEIIIFLPIPIPNISSTEDYEILYTLRLIFCKSVPIRPNSSKQVSLIVYLLYKYKARHYLKMLLWFVLSLFQFHYRHGVAQFWWSLCFCMVSMQEVVLLFHSAFYNSFYGILGGYETFIVPLSAAIFRFCAISYLMLRINYHFFGVTSLALFAFCCNFITEFRATKEFLREAKDQDEHLRNIMLPATAQEVAQCDDVCSVCLGAIKSGILRTSCGHFFHDVCIRRSIGHRPKCPMCNKKFKLPTF